VLRPAFAPLDELAGRADADGVILQVDERCETVRHGAEEVRAIARRLRPNALEELGLPAAQNALAGAFERQARVQVEKDVACHAEASCANRAP
jgi:two-component system sensor histidine kinase UhpB